MPILSSLLAVGQPQVDGRRFITEKHTDHLGAVYIFEYLDSGAINHNATLTARIASLEAQLKTEDSHLAIFGSDPGYQLKHASAAELAAFARVAYKNSSKQELAKIATRILAWISSGRFTDTQVRNAFSLNAVQWTALKLRLQSLADNHAAVNAAEGE